MFIPHIRFKHLLINILLTAFVCSTALAVTITYGPVIAPIDPAGGGYPTSVKVIWWTDTATSSNTAYIGTTASGPWTFTATDTTSATRHEALVTGLTADSRYYVYVNSNGATSSVSEFRTGLNLLTNGSLETWHSVSGQDWGAEEPDGWHGWEVYPWTPPGSNNPMHLSISKDRNTGVPSPLFKDGSHRVGMDEGWRSCYGGIYQSVSGLQAGTYIVSGWAAWLFDGVSGVNGHVVEILAKDGPHTPGSAPTATTIFSQNGSVNDQNWKYVQGTVECTTGTITIYANLRSDNWDGTSFAHFDGLRLMAVTQPAVRFSNFQYSRMLNGSVYDITITFDTDIPIVTSLQWGATSSYGSTTAPESTASTHHTFNLTGVTSQSFSYHYKAHATASGGIDEYSTDQTFEAPKLQRDIYLSIAMIGGSVSDGGDDVGPGNEVQYMTEADWPLISYSGLSAPWWPSVQPTDPGTGPNVYIWPNESEWKKGWIPGKSRQAYFQMYGSAPSWLTLDSTRYWEKFEQYVEAMTVKMNQVFGDVDYIFENEPNISRAPDGWNWADWYIHCLQHFYVAVHRADAQTGKTNRVIAGNLAGHSAGGFAELYSRGLKNYSDVLGYHPYPDDLRTGLEISDLAQIHSTQVQYGDANKKIIVTEGWGSGRSAGFDRSTPTIDPSADEIENMWLAMINGWDRVMTPRTNWDPSYLYGMRFFCGNDNWGMEKWRSRAIPQKDSSGNIIGFIVDGYWMTPDISPQFWNGGMLDWYGNSKDCLIHVFPGDGLVFMNPGFELHSSPSKEHLPHFWTTMTDPATTANYDLDNNIFHGGGSSLKLTESVSGNIGVYQATAKRSAVPGSQYRARVWVKTQDSSNLSARFYIRFKSIDGSQSSTQYWAPAVTGTGDWQQVEVTAPAPSYTSRIEAGCSISGVGTAWFDDVTISALEQQQIGSVRGYTCDELQHPVANCVVRTTTGGYQAISDSRGYYEMTNVAAGTYDFVCRKAGYVPHRVKNQTVAPGKMTFVSYNMGTPKPGLTVTQITSDSPTALVNGSPVNVVVYVSNSKQYPVTVSDVGLFVEQNGQDATGKFTILPSVSNPKMIHAYGNSQFAFTVKPSADAQGQAFTINAYAFGQEDRPNLLTNGNFDMDSSFTHWGFWGSSSVCNWTMETGDVFSMPNALKNYVSHPNSDAMFNWAANYSIWGNASVPTKPNQNYIVGAYHKDTTSGLVDLLLYIEEYYFDGTNRYYNGRHFSAVPHRNVWSHDSMMYKTGDPNETPGLYPANRLRISVGACTKSAGASSTALWDDVYVKEDGDWLADDGADAGRQIVVPKIVSSLSQALSEQSGSYVQVSGPVLTAGSESFTGRYYAEQEDRATGYLIAASGSVPVKGTKVIITGKVGSIDGERALLDSTLSPLTQPGVPSALGMAARTLTASNLTSQGLLVKVWGRVSYIAQDNSYFTIDDGSGLTDGAGHEGIKVICTGTTGGITPPTLDSFVVITGISGCEQNGSLQVVRPRSQADIR